MKKIAALSIIALSAITFASASDTDNLTIIAPPAAESVEGKVTSLNVACNVSMNCNYTMKSVMAKPSDILQKCVSVNNNSSNKMANLKIKIVPDRDRLAGHFKPVNIYGEGKKYGTWINIEGNNMYFEYNETVVMGKIEPNQKFFVCQAFHYN